MSTTKPTTKLVGRRIRVHDDTPNLTARGGLSPYAGQEGKVIVKGVRGTYTLQLDDGQVIAMHMKRFEVLPEPGDLAQPGGDESAAVVDASMGMLDRRCIVPSLTNPRTHFSEEALEDLAESIKLHGLASAVLVRPLPADRLGETFDDRLPGDPLPTHELVAGERRWRACEIAGLRLIPAQIRLLSDLEVLHLQLVENLKRADLTPIEEAEGYERLVRIGKLRPEDIAEQIGKSRTYVFETLRLLELDPAVRNALENSRVTRTVAKMIMRIPLDKQAKLLAEVATPDKHGEVMSKRQAEEHIEKNYKPPAPPPPPVEDDLVAQAEANGQQAIVGREAREIIGADGALDGYRDVDEQVDAGDGQFRPLRDVLGPDMPTPAVMQDPSTQQTREVLPTAVFGQVLQQQAARKVEAQQSSADALRKAQGIIDGLWRKRAIERTHQAILDDAEREGFHSRVIRGIAQDLITLLPLPVTDYGAQLLGLGKIASGAGLVDYARTCNGVQAERLLALVYMLRDLEAEDNADSQRIAAVAQDYAIDVDQVREEVKAEIRDQVEAAAAPAPTASAPVPAAPRGRKASATDAQAAIAQAMQAAPNPNAFEVGQQVRIKVDIRGLAGVQKVKGKEGRIEKPSGDRAWMVRYGEGIDDFAFADYTELEVV